LLGDGGISVVVRMWTWLGDFSGHSLGEIGDDNVGGVAAALHIFLLTYHRRPA
jgi:hypothetical protein